MMAEFIVENQPWQHWPKKLVVRRKYRDPDKATTTRVYIPDDKVTRINGWIFSCPDCGLFRLDRMESYSCYGRECGSNDWKADDDTFAKYWRPTCCPVCGKEVH